MTREQGQSSPDIAVEREQRVEHLNSILRTRNLAPLYNVEELGDAARGEIEVREIDQVIDCGDGLNLVEVKTLNPDGNQGRFVTFFRDRESLSRQNLLVPFVTGAPGNLEFPDDIAPPDETVARINQQLAEFNLRRLPTIVNSTTETIVDVDRVIDTNSRFFTVVVLKVRDARGEIREKPMTFNANSASGIDGAVFGVFGKMPQFGMEPRILIGEQYRHTQGGWVTETFRGFYSPRKGGQDAEFRSGITNVPAMKRALDELMDETGMREADSMHRVGRLKQDPATDFIYPDFWLVEAEMAEFGQQDLEASERIRMKSLSAGEYFASVSDIRDPFTIAALTKALLHRRQLRVNRKGLDSQEKMVFTNQFRFQYGRHLTEVGRGSVDDIGASQDLGPIAFNSGVARITPNIYSGNMSWGEYKERVGEEALKKVNLLHPFEALLAIEQGQIDDILTITATIKALHAKGYLELGNPR